MLFDSFVFDDVDLCSSIIRNISDILDTYNHTNNNNLPFAFGIVDVTNSNAIVSIKNSICCAITSFEQRLCNVCVDVIKSNSSDQLTICVSGEYKNAGKVMKLSFKKAMSS